MKRSGLLCQFPVFEPFEPRVLLSSVPSPIAACDAAVASRGSISPACNIAENAPVFDSPAPFGEPDGGQSLSADGTEPVPGDANGDRAVTDADYTIWADHYGASSADASMGDFNGDGVVSDADYTVWADYYGYVPYEPPEANDDYAETVGGTPVQIDVLDNDTGENLQIYLVMDGEHGTADHDGSVATYTPDDGWDGTDTFHYVITDGQENYSAGTVTVLVEPYQGPTYTHLPSLDPQWDATETYDALEPGDFDEYWTSQLASLPAPDGAWNGGLIDIGGGKVGDGLVDWNGATTSARKPCLVMLPSAGAAPGLGICPNNNNFILASAMGVGNAYRGGTSLGNGEFTEAILAIQQAIRNIKASGKCNGNFFVIGKSQGGGMAVITAGLSPDVRDLFASVPALTGFTGSGGTTGAWPGYPSTQEAGYIDAVNHAKRVTCPATFSISYNDDVTWGRGQVTCARNTQAHTTVNHGWDGHYDGDWWSLGTAWLATLDLTATNGAPAVNAGADQMIYLPATATSLDATVQDDGLPEDPGAVAVEWTQVSGPGTVTFGDSTAVDTTATFSETGAYVLRLTGDDGELSAWDELTVRVRPEDANDPPTVDAGADQSIALPVNSVDLDATVHDDGRPLDPGAFTVEWTRVSGPGTVTFGDATAVDTSATFSETGVYVLRLTADDGELSGFDELTVTSNTESPVGTEVVLTPPATGTATGSEYCPATAAFDAQPTWDAELGMPVGENPDPYGNTDTEFYNRYWYIDFGPDYARYRIVAVWTRYRPWSGGSFDGYPAMWWDDDTDIVNDSGAAETQLNFASGQGVPNLDQQLWIEDMDLRDAPLTPQHRYLVVSSGENAPLRANEFALIGFIVPEP